MEKFLKYNIYPKIDSKNPQHAQITIGPLERGFGTTLGNALRRTMLTSLPGASVFAIKIPHVSHEFQALKGVKEDVTQIILNLKNLIIKIDESTYSDEELNNLKIENWPTMKIFNKGSKQIHANDIELPAGFEILNRDLYICSVTDNSIKFEMEIYATRGRGFRSFNQNKEIVNTISIIATDSNFSPIVRVGYAIEEQKVSKNVTGDILVLDIATTGAISPENAVAYTSKILVEHFMPLVNINEAINQIEIMNQQVEQQKATTLATPIEDLNLSVRSYNCLKRRGINTIQELASMSKTEIEKIKNLGKKSLREIIKQLQSFGITFKEE